jgi:hypothetical protein
MYCTVHIILHLLLFINDNMWNRIHALYSTYHTPLVVIHQCGVWYVLYNTWIWLHLLTLMNYNKWSMICTVQYMDLSPPVNIDELHQVEYDMYCTIHGSYSTCKQWWITSNGVSYVLYNTLILLHLLTLMNYIKWGMICNVQYMDLTPPINIDELQQVEYDVYCTTNRWSQIHVFCSTNHTPLVVIHQC